MVPTYFRRELRDRVLQRRSRLRTFVFLPSGSCLSKLRPRHARGLISVSCPAQAGHPVRRAVEVFALASLEYWITRPSAQGRTRRVMTAGLVLSRGKARMSNSKAELRAKALAARDALSEKKRIAAAAKLAKRGLPFQLLPGSIVSGYSPIRSEIDPMPLLKKLAEEGARLALPCVTARGQSLIF